MNRAWLASRWASAPRPGRPSRLRCGSWATHCDRRAAAARGAVRALRADRRRRRGLARPGSSCARADRCRRTSSCSRASPAAASRIRPTRAAHEVSVLRKRMEEPRQVLRKARFRGPDGERRTVAQLPWYMFIGAPGSGKTTALLNSGLRFPLGDPRGERALQGVGGTRNCDWWFTDEAVLLDTAGRYTTQESDREADAAAWLGFLDLLKRFRPRQPLNGVIVTLSVADLVHWTDDGDGSATPRTCASASAELYAAAGRAPAGLRAGHQGRPARRLHGVLRRPRRRRPRAGLGHDLRRPPRSPPTPARALRGGIRAPRAPAVRACCRSACRRSATCSAAPRSTASRSSSAASGPLIARVPGKRLRQRLVAASRRCCAACTSPAARRKAARSTACSARWRAASTSSARCSRRTLGSGKSYFLRRLLHEVIFGEAGLAGSDPAQERAHRRARVWPPTRRWRRSRSRSRRHGPRAISATAAWWRSAESARSAAARELESLREVRPGDEARLVAALNTLRGAAGRAGSAAAAAGLYQGEKLDAQAERAYRNALRESLLGAPRAVAGGRAARRREPRACSTAYLALYDDCRCQALEQATLRALAAARGGARRSRRAPAGRARRAAARAAAAARRRAGRAGAAQARRRRRAHDRVQAPPPTTASPSAGTARFPAPATSSRGAFRRRSASLGPLAAGRDRRQQAAPRRAAGATHSFPCRRGASCSARA